MRFDYIYFNVVTFTDVINANQRINAKNIFCSLTYCVFIIKTKLKTKHKKCKSITIFKLFSILYICKVQMFFNFFVVFYYSYSNILQNEYN